MVIKNNEKDKLCKYCNRVMLEMFGIKEEKLGKNNEYRVQVLERYYYCVFCKYKFREMNNV